MTNYPFTSFITCPLFHVGDLIMPLSHIPNPAKTAKTCNLKMLQDDYLTGSIIKAKHMKGWWPFQYNPDDDDDPKPKLAVGTKCCS